MVRKVDPDKHEEKRLEILEAAHRCFLRHGLQGASTAAICKEAKISPGHLYHYFPSKEAIVEQMAENYLERLHAHFANHEEGQETSVVLLSELWSMNGWDDLDHCRILFELLAEAGRTVRIREILRKNTSGVRSLLKQALAAGQKRGEVDAALDPEQTSAILIAVLDAVPMLPLMAPDIDFKESRRLVSTMVGRFLRPQKNKAGSGVDAPDRSAQQPS
ncbi:MULTISPECIES: TetR/AcrR family transcriptional regulator [unclassified Chelatococcus]|uniref:TetR/AcrR family transcriptional regulator n=1 Tax=unclassified Chelatococcus TaxID=2638111 RepID=UPI001BD14B86|nr:MULTISPECIES: TetR/AcrR family transcriptional regulator [unclassified Chelatococcus]MBS7700375.1 TetR/AcrR family transcriptional regulator [Chelatococcus sp. YT9]MBX3556171.1 TetR/AcrR family transcriptional regulator [Chelatococcus sp.]